MVGGAGAMANPVDRVYNALRLPDFYPLFVADAGIPN